MSYCSICKGATRDVALYCDDCVDAEIRAERRRLAAKLLEEATALDVRAFNAHSDATRSANLIAAGVLRGLADNLGTGPEKEGQK